ncbi:MAG: hypothetical protein LIP15_04075 [Clostridium sp.]|nr:hypothetical protein [Clostridium sp.]
MTLDVELTDREADNIENGGFIVLHMGGMRITISKDDLTENKEEKQ